MPDPKDARPEHLSRLVGRVRTERKEKSGRYEIEELSSESAIDLPKLRNAVQSLQSRRMLGTSSAFRSAFTIEAIVSVLLVFGWATLAHFYRDNLNASMYFTLVAPAPMALLLGLLLGRPRGAFAIGVVAILALVPTLYKYIYDLNPTKFIIDQEPIAMAYMRTADGRYQVFDNGKLVFNILALIAYGTLGAYFSGLLASFGARTRDRFVSDEGGLKSLSRQEIIRLVVVCQEQLGQYRQHAAFVSVDVVGSTMLRQGLPELDSEHAFSTFRRFVESIVFRHDGQVQMSAGDGIMAMFFEDRLALQFARDVLESLEEFNGKHNRIGKSFALRIGISAGDMAIDQELSLGQLQSPIIDRAASLQKCAPVNTIVIGFELESQARALLGDLETSEDDDVSGYVWRVKAA
ncbi:MAG: hypothetical protein HONBIEJF_00009 [Fimbriimonadaceae bacterium]|nr:hypothetical protein [Fimbriimonadaceae bacterium]